MQLIRQAIDRGMTFMDNCWDYNDGASQVRMGKALKDGYRQKVFLMDKIDGRTKKAAAEQIDQCLQRLQTDVIDLLQHHEVIRLEDPDRIFAEGGAQEAVLAAQKAGKVRFIGFTGHKDLFVHLRMHEVAAKHGFRFDAEQMPLNVMDAHFRSFERDVLPVLNREGIAPLGMKAFGHPYILHSNTVTPMEALHYCLHLPIAVQITGIDSQQLDQALEAVRTFKLLTQAEVASLWSAPSRPPWQASTSSTKPARASTARSNTPNGSVRTRLRGKDGLPGDARTPRDQDAAAPVRRLALGPAPCNGRDRRISRSHDEEGHTQ